MKTGHTQEAGYGLVGSAKQGDRRVVFVVTGLDSAAARAEEGQRILNWSFRQFAQKNVIETGTRVAEASVWMGQAPTVGLTVAEDVSMLVPILSGDSIDGEVVFNAPIEAPIAAGQTLGELIIRFDDLPERRIPLVAEADVPVGGFAIRMRTAVMVLLDKVMSNADMATTDDNA
jgi:D-alanyl-D-alanine carboxypeptidase (penicillin-binding protein 5/6)